PGEEDGTALDHETDARAELERLGHHGRSSEGYERVEGMPVLPRQVGAAGPRALAAGGDVRVFGEPHGLEAAGFQFAGELVDRYGVVGREHGDAVLHAISPPSLELSNARR